MRPRTDGEVHGLHRLRLGDVNGPLLVVAVLIVVVPRGRGAGEGKRGGNGEKRDDGVWFIVLALSMGEAGPAASTRAGTRVDG